MTTITLQQYHEQINQLLEDSQYDLAVEHCRHILQQQPQHVATYRLLAKTLLERGDYDGARELFQRVLSADPNDHIAHAGLAIIFKEEEVPAQAIWHLERAYEIEPYNTAIQQELRALYTNQIENRRRGQKNGDTAVIPTTLLLTKGALARLYLRGELYDQATAVLRTALSADEERIDLRVLLMEALWRDGRRIEAVNVALQVLDQLPNCIMANAVLAEIWLRTGRVDEAQGYLQRLQDMLLLDADHFDPEAPEGSAFRAEGAIPLPKVVELDYLGAEGAMAEFEGPSTWTPGPAAEAEEPEAEAEDDMYQWLTGLTGELPPLEEAEASDQAEQTVTYESGLISATEPTSDWLDDLLAEDEESDLEMAAGSVQSQKEPQNKRVTLFPSAADETIPEWLAEDEEDETEAEASPPPAAFPPAVEADEFAPDWLADLAGDDLEPMEVDAQTAAAWLRENEQIDEEREEADSDAFDWLDTPLADSQDVMVDSESGVLDLSQFAGFQMDLDEVEEEEDDFEWRLTDELNALSTGSQEEAAHLPEDVEEQDELGLEAPADIPDDLPDWLMTGSVTGDLYEEKQSASDELAEELADWVAANSPELPAEEDFADWQPEDELDEDEITLWDEQEVEPAEAEATLADDSSSLPDSGDLPAWLSSEAVPDSVDSRLLGTSQFSEDVPDDEDEDDEFLQSQIGDELPGWLQDDSTAVADEQERISTGDLPAWLRGAGLEAVESSPLEEPVVAEADDAALAGDAQADTFPGETPETPKFSTESDLLRAAAELDLSTQEELAAADDLPGWLFADEELVESERAESPDVDVEAVMGDENEEKYTGPEDEQATQPEQLRPSDEEMDWLDDLAAMSGAESSALDVLNDTGELPEWMVMDEDELASARAAEEEEPEEPETAVSAEEEEPAAFTAVPLEEEPDLNWLDALAADEAQSETVEELPTWQWPEDEPVSADLTEEALETMFSGDEPREEQESEAVSEPEAADFPDDLDDAMSWLEDLAGEPDAPVEELPTVAEDLDFDDLFALAGEAEPLAEAPSEEEDLELPPDDPEAAMAWLEQLAARQGAPLDELPSVKTEEAASEDEAGEVSELFDLDELGEAEVTLIAAEVREETAVDEDFSLDVPDDPDEAMAWLERLAARQGAPLDELPSITEETDLDDFFGEDVLAELGDLEGEDQVSAAAEITAEAADEADEDLDDAMAWLEQLAADQETTTDARPFAPEEMDSELEEVDLFVVETTAVSQAGDDLSEAMDWLDDLAQTEEGEEEETAVPDWLTVDEAESEPAVPEQTVVTSALLAELAWLESEVDMEPAEDMADFDLDEVEVSDEDLEAALNQLDMLALTPSIPEEEEPVTESEELSEESDDLETFLEEALELPQEPEADTAVVATIVEETLIIEETADEGDLPALEDTADLDLEAIPDDPDEAMAWLERLAARQGASLDELPSLHDADEETLAALTAVPPTETAGVDEEVEETAVADLDVPENIDDAMAWLEQLAARQGASLDELPTVTETDDEVKTPDWIAAQAAAEEEATQSADGLTPADELAAELETLLDETAPLSEPEVELGVPDDIDDAMAWLEQLAARQGTSLDELPSVTPETAVDEDLDAPAWIAAAQAAAAADEEEEEADDAALADEETADLFAADETSAELDEVADSLPDWLTTEGEDEYLRVGGHTDWLGSLPEPDLDGWLAAEEEATISGTGDLHAELPPVPTSGKTGPLLPKSETGPLSGSSLPDTADLDEDLLIPDMDLGLSALDVDEEQLNGAREALASGEIENALNDYAALVEKGEGLNTLIADLEAASSQHTDRPLVRRMLGDAYMRNGQLQKALDTYRQALDQM